MKPAKIIIDSSSAILLYKVNLFDLLAEKFKTTITKSVYSELTKTNYPGSDYFTKTIDQQKLSINNNISNDNLKDEKLLHLGDGEKDSILLFLYYKFDFIIIDDRKGAKYCKNYNIPYINALLVPKIFYLSKIISKEKYLQKTKEISSIGRYSDKIIEFVYQCTVEDLKTFLPVKISHEDPYL